MSQQSPDGEDPNIISLVIQFRGLSISVYGPVAASLDFVHRLTGDLPDSAPTSVSGVSASEIGANEVREEICGSIQNSFATYPPNILGLASRLSGASRLSPVERIQRAFRAGQWALAVRQGRIGTPNQTPTIELPNRFYVVFWSPSIPSPRVFIISRSFFAAVGDLSTSGALCHGFPSEREARAYLAGAGAVYPEAENP